MLWGYSSTGSNEALCIHPRSLELSVKARMLDPCPSCWMVIYIDVSEASNARRFNVRTAFHSGGMYQRHSMTLLLYPLMTYLQASDHSVTVGFMNTILFIGNPLTMTHWSIFIQ